MSFLKVNKITKHHDGTYDLVPHLVNTFLIRQVFHNSEKGSFIYFDSEDYVWVNETLENIPLMMYE